jgi:hypothetical protein
VSGLGLPEALLAGEASWKFEIDRQAVCPCHLSDR